MLDNLQLTYTPNDEDDEASAYEICTDDGHWAFVGTVLVSERYDAESVADLFVNSPKLLASVRAFVDWALRQPPRPRPNLDPIVEEARRLLARLA